MKLVIYFYVCVCVPSKGHWWGSEDDLWGSVLSLCLVASQGSNSGPSDLTMSSVTCLVGVIKEINVT